MAWSLVFEDKYRLWSAVVQGVGDRLFVPTDELPIIGAEVPVRVALPSQGLERRLRGKVVGRRRAGERFPGGIYVQFPREELDASRAYFGMVQSPERYQRGRRAPRVYRPLPARFRLPEISEPCQVNNLSQTGLNVSCPVPLEARQRVELELTLDDGTQVALSADVVWTKPAENVAGLHLVDLSPMATEMLRSAVHRLMRVTGETTVHGKRAAVMAEGDEESMGLLNEVLALQRVTPFHVQTGDDVLSLARWLRPMVVFLDILMPGVDAVDVCRMMRADVELADIPIVFFSRMDEDRLRAVADDAGATDYLVKPTTMGELYRLIGRYVSPPSK